MEQFDGTLNKYLQQSKDSLQRVRFKVDPGKVSGHEEMADVEEYVGYVLQEFEDGSADIYIPGDGADNMSIMRMVLPVQDGGRYKYLKQMISKALPSKGVGDKQQEVESLDCIHKLEDFMKMNNFADSEIIEIFKEYISETEPS